MGLALEAFHGEIRLVDSHGDEAALADSHIIETRMLPPFFLILLSAILKPLASVLLFGPPRPEVSRVESCVGRWKLAMKRLAQAGFLALAVTQFVFDVTRIVAAVSSRQVAWWDRVCSLFLVLSISSNLGSGCSALGLLELSGESLRWQASHGHDVGRREALGLLGLCYVCLMSWIGFAMVVTLLFFCVPALLAYCYVSVPLCIGLVALSLAMASWFPMLVARLRGTVLHGTLRDVPMPGSEDACKAHLRAMDPFHPEVPDWHAEYMKNRQSYELTGVCWHSWASYFYAGFCLAPPLSFFTPVAARLYTGQGYVHALTRTVVERHFSSYVHHVVEDATSACIFLWLIL